MNIDLGQTMTFLLVMLRMTGMLVASPIFGRRNIPVMFSLGLAMSLAALITRSMSFPPLPDLNLFSFFYMSLMELAIGITAGFVTQLFVSVMIVGGEVADMQLGLGMAKVFDPASNASVSLTATMLNAMFILTFFATNNHLTFIYMTAQTFRVLPVGGFALDPQVLSYIPELFSSVVLFAIKLSLPIAVVELIVTMAVGIIMRIIPQVNIFVVNIQFKLFVGLFALMVLVAPFTGFIENMIIICFERVQEAWGYFFATPV